MRRLVRRLLNRYDLAAYRSMTALLRAGRNGAPPAPEQLRETVAAGLRHPDWQVANEAVKAVGQFTLAEFLPQLVAMLGCSSSIGFVRRNAAVSLGAFAELPGEAIAALGAALEDGYWEVRCAAMESLVGHQAGLPGLEERLSAILAPTSGQWLNPWVEPNFEVRMTACEVLGQFASSRVTLDALIRVLADENWRVRGVALAAAVEVSLRGKHPRQLLDSAMSRFDQTCIDIRPRFPLHTTYNRALARWEEEAG